MPRKEMILFVIWTGSALGVLGLGGHMLLSQPYWVSWFPSPLLAFFSVLVLPTGILTLTSFKWFFEVSRE